MKKKKTRIMATKEYVFFESVIKENKGNNKITELRTIFQRESQNS